MVSVGAVGVEEDRAWEAAPGLAQGAHGGAEVHHHVAELHQVGLRHSETEAEAEVDAIMVVHGWLDK